MHVRACALFLSLSINNSRGRCVFYGSNGLNDGTTKTSHRETMVTFQACPDCSGVANETVPFLVPCPCLRPGQMSRDCTIILSLKLAKSNNDSACSQRFFLISQVLNPRFWFKNAHFSNFFFLGNIGQENVFYDFL